MKSPRRYKDYGLRKDPPANAGKLGCAAIILISLLALCLITIAS